MDHTPQLPDNLKNKVSSLNEEYGPQVPSNLIKKTSVSMKQTASEPESSEIYGPSLPFHLHKKKTEVNMEYDCESYGPSLPPHLLRTNAVSGSKSCAVSSLKIGTVTDPCDRLPSDGSDESNQSDNEYGPSLPPHLKNSKSSQPSQQGPPDGICKSESSKFGTPNERTYGPVMPPHIKAASVTSETDDDSEEDSYCPALPPHLKKKQSSNSNLESCSMVKEKPAMEVSDYESSGDDEVYGPMPPTQQVNIDEYIESTIQQRTEATEKRLNNASNAAPKREDWMLTLPEDKPLFAGLGLQARQFSKSGKRDRGDTSVWTDTPADKERKAKRAAEGRAPAQPEEAEKERRNARDERLQAAVERHNDAKRSQPLIDTHQGKQKKAKKDGLSVTGIGADRKPFSREEDLHVNKFDEAQKSSILKKARDLNDRFSSGKSSKFL